MTTNKCAWCENSKPTKDGFSCSYSECILTQQKIFKILEQIAKVKGGKQ